MESSIKAIPILAQACAEPEVIGLHFDVNSLAVQVIDHRTGTELEVLFSEPEGFRALDEGALLEFWPVCSTQNGWLYSIKSGGWLAQESQRPGFVPHENTKPLEFFIVGMNYCVSILAWSEPKVVLGSNS